MPPAKLDSAQGAGQYWNIADGGGYVTSTIFPCSRLHDRAMRLASIGKREFLPTTGLSELFFKPTAIDE